MTVFGPKEQRFFVGTTTLGESRSLGIDARNMPQGVGILEVTRNSPAERIRVVTDGRSSVRKLEVGDLLTHINGRRITNDQEFGKALDASGSSMTIEFISINDNKTYTGTVILGK